MADTTDPSFVLAQRILDLAYEKKAFSPRIFDVAKLFGYTDFVVILSGRSDRQVRAIADHVSSTLKTEDKVFPIGIEGEDVGQWVLMDYGDVVVHLFNGPVREYYELDGLFHDAPALKIPEPAWEAEMRGGAFDHPAYTP